MTVEFESQGIRDAGKGYKFHARLQIMPKTLLTTCPTRFLDGVLPLLISIDFKSLVYSGTVDNLYLLDRLLVMYFSTPFLLQNRYWILRRLPASFIQTVWQYGLLSFQTGGTKLERVSPKN